MDLNKINPFKKNKFNGYETYSPDSGFKVFFNSFNPLSYNSLSENNSLWKIFKEFLFSMMIVSILFLILFIPKINSLDFENQMTHFDNFSITINQSMNSPIEFPSNHPFVFINTISNNKSQNSPTIIDLNNYSMDLFNDTSILEKTKEQTNQTLIKIKEATHNASTFIYVDDKKILFHSFFNSKSIYFNNFSNPKKNTKSYEDLFKFLIVLLLPSIFFVMFLFLSIKFIWVSLFFVLLCWIIFLFTKRKISFSKIIKFALLSSIPASLINVIVFVYWIHTFMFFLPCFIFLIYFLISISKFSYKEEDFSFNK